MRRASRIWLATLALALAGGAARADSDRLKVAVLGLHAKGGITAEQADALGDLLANSVRDLGRFDVVAKNDIHSMVAFEQIKDKLGCDETTCLAEIGGALGVDRVVSGNVTRIGRALLLNLRLINPRGMAVAGGVSRKITGGDDKLIDALPEAVAELFRDEDAEAAPADSGAVAAAPARPPARVVRRLHTAPAKVGEASPAARTVRVKILPDVAEARILVDGALIGSGPVEVELEVGEHSFRAEAEGYPPAEEMRRIQRPVDVKLELAARRTELRTRAEWIAIRGFAGGGADFDLGAAYYLGAEFTAYTLRWESFYWELLRGGYGTAPIGFYYGTALGYPVHLDEAGEHELRLGVHVTAIYDSYPGLSGVQVAYLYRGLGAFTLEVGLLQFSYPPSGSLTLGLRM